MHFGVYRNKVAVNPNSIVKVEKEQIVTKEQAKFKQLVKDTNENIRKILVSNENPKKLENFDNFVMLN